MKGTPMNNVLTLARQLNDDDLFSGTSYKVMAEAGALNCLATLLDVNKICGRRVAIFHWLCLSNAATMLVALRTLSSSVINAEIDACHVNLARTRQQLTRFGTVSALARKLDACRLCGGNLADFMHDHGYDLESAARSTLPANASAA